MTPVIVMWLYVAFWHTQKPIGGTDFKWMTPDVWKALYVLFVIIAIIVTLGKL